MCVLHCCQGPRWFQESVVFLVGSSESCFWQFWSQQCLYHIVAHRKYIALVKRNWTLHIIGCQDRAFPPAAVWCFPSVASLSLERPADLTVAEACWCFSPIVKCFSPHCLLLSGCFKFVFLLQIMSNERKFLHCSCKDVQHFFKYIFLYP